MGLRDSIGRLDRMLDRRLEQLPDISSQRDRDAYRAAVKTGVSRATRKAGATIRSLDELGDRTAGKLRPKRGVWDRWIEYSVHHPMIVLLSILLITGLIATQAIYIQKEMRGDMEIYLPSDDESTRILTEVRQSWATDIIVVYVKATDWNKDGKLDNLTNYESLVEMSHVEGDDTNKDAAREMAKGIDPDKGDRGKDDRIVYCLSISTLIKEVNSTPARIAHQFGLPETSGTYAIPPDQTTIDTIVGAIPVETLSSLLKDTDKDGIYDRAAIIIGVKSGTPPAQIVGKVDSLLKDKDMRPTHCTMTNTGPMTVIEKIQGRTILEFLKVMPFVVVYLMLTMYVFHRTFKAPVVGIIPVALALIITYGIVGALHSYLIISPQIALVAPMLLALGISYCHFIINRYTEEKLGTPFERAARAAKIMTPAIVLSATATAIGFFSLMVGTLAPIAVMGFALGLGILLTCVLMLTLVPSLMVFTKYKKGVHWGGWRRLGSIPSDHRKKTLLVVIVFVTISILLLSSVKFNADYLAMAPTDDPSFTNMNEYSRTMGGGQMGMVIVRGDAKDVDVLKGMDALEKEMNKAPFTKCMSVVDIMKMIKAPEDIDIPIVGPIHLGLNVSYWTVITSISNTIAQGFLVNSFYAALSPEMLSFLVNDDYSKTLIYIFQPMMDIELTRQAVNGVNNAIDSKPIAGATVSHLTGVGAIELAVNDLLISGQLISLAVCTFATWLVLLAVFRSWKLSMFTMIPCLVVVGLEPLVLVGLNIPLSIVTVMIGSIGIGTGVDFSIQLSQRIRTGGLHVDSVKNSVENLGISFVEATTVTVFAFMAVLLSPGFLVDMAMGNPWHIVAGVPIDSVRQFVIMIQVLFCLNAIAAMFILPAIYTVWLRFREAEKKRKEKEGW
jgi:predicted RND superfamily exporter protein